MAPVYHGHWSFDTDTFYVASSDGYVHPRASYSELDNIFSAPIGDSEVRNTPDHEGHWYEAQLLHFGLAPTKNKAEAKMRLMDAFQDDTLDIPDEILQIETTLSRDWIKKDLETRILGPSMQPSHDTGAAGPTTTDTTGADALNRPSGSDGGNVFGAALAAAAIVRGNMRSQRNKNKPPPAHNKKRTRHNADSSNRPLKTARCGETGTNLQVRIHINTNSESFHQISTDVPKSVENTRGRPAPDRELQQIAYQTVPLPHQTTYGTNTQGIQLPPPAPMDTDGASDYCGYGYKPAMYSSQSRSSMVFQEQ
ncbi:unnamed protein product [Penicillium glandicola]